MLSIAKQNIKHRGLGIKKLIEKLSNSYKQGNKKGSKLAWYLLKSQ
ncbi:hypothetical protein JavanS595_0009 [Streptococcus satellite phage Javan595]|nr:hypothetical protein TL13_1318 [Streptococcus suis TL13]QBX11613.1 hypothetical protein JavanS595_0009 [Streptococcus satellite phage Javan595]